MNNEIKHINGLIEVTKNNLLSIDKIYNEYTNKTYLYNLYLNETDVLKSLNRRKNRLLGIIKE